MTGEASELDKFIDPSDLEGVSLDTPTLEVTELLVENLATEAALAVRFEDEPKTDQERRDNILRRNERKDTLERVAKGIGLLLEHSRGQ